MIPIPANIPWRAIGAGALAAALFSGGWVVNGWRVGAQLEQMRGDRERAAKSAAFDQVKAVDRARAEEQRRTAAQTEIANVAIKDAERARDDARTAAATSDRLRQRIADLIASAGHPAAATGSPPAGDPIGMLANVLERADRRAGILAEYADAARIAGLACERSYDALTPAQ
ncbi:DUF2514 family protein [Cupriavidus taiwanensis]|uniref:DUF2514 family protein n=1 Tax=Cupriavidus taiwanensis TaxID=164546 RepID=UPI000E10E5F1|nr:DUF2514 family protein [Cupriavidus taiwanensis]SOY56883.1 conserved hypothetical protein [Cupriavidus taiwanensis]SOY90831.1 conserved hypothetical protein [Cupriavidus taiwanensis]SOZ63630.1 conserved hypothetical protein [Cupriavidus taiwanensis]SOZ82636.1 conserved hypothetical protein [Cupriavidus taiwanensis]SOZ84468.1 conserved hypothetical protein [Cupriavidus taiwanensis]